MAADISFNQAQSMAGLGTFNLPAVVTAGQYYVSCKSFIQPGSGLQIVINHNGSPVVTIGGSSQNPAQTQTFIGTATQFYCAATDTISIVLTSSNAVDSVPNNVKSNMNCFYQMQG